jgi:hypothetical protein
MEKRKGKNQEIRQDARHAFGIRRRGRMGCRNGRLSTAGQWVAWGSHPCGLGVVLDLLLLLQSTHPLNIKGMEATGVGGLIRGELLLAGLQADTAGLADSDHHHATRLAFPRLIFLLREGDTDLRHGTRWGTGGVLHQSALLIIDDDGVGLASSDCEAALMGGHLAIVDGENRFFAGQALAAENEQATDQGESEQDQNQKRDQQVDHGCREAILGVAIISGNDFRKVVHHRADREAVVEVGMMRVRLSSREERQRWVKLRCKECRGYHPG